MAASVESLGGATLPSPVDGADDRGGVAVGPSPLRSPGYVYGHAAAIEAGVAGAAEHPQRGACQGPQSSPAVGAHSRAPVAITSGPRSRPRATGGSLAARPAAAVAFGRRVLQDSPHAASRLFADAASPKGCEKHDVAAAAVAAALQPRKSLLRAARHRTASGAPPPSSPFMSGDPARTRRSGRTRAQTRRDAESNPDGSALSPVSSSLASSRCCEGAHPARGVPRCLCVCVIAFDVAVSGRGRDQQRASHSGEGAHLRGWPQGATVLHAWYGAGTS